MALDLAALVEPAHTALVISECQQGVIGEQASIPDLAAAARAGMLPRVAELARAARAAGVTVVHGVAHRREDGRGANENARLFQYTARSPVQLTPGTPAVEVMPEIGVEKADIVSPRLHGLSPFSGTELDAILRNLGVRTIVAAGVSVNVAVTNLCFDAVNASYQVVVPRDAVAGFPAAYVEAVFENTLGAVTTLVSTADLVELWRA